MIEFMKVTKNFSEVIGVQDLNLRIEQGEIFGLVGPDGAGKTTTIRLMLGLLKNFTGKITVLGTENVERIKGRFGYVPQRFSLYQDLSVLENIELIGALYGVKSSEIQEKAEEILTFTGLWEFRHRLSGNLSGGMKQKLALAAGLMHKPEVFFLDEPTTGVDPVARREFWQLLYELNKTGMTIIVATPYMDEAELCHRVVLMKDGSLVSCATPNQLIENYPYKILSLETPMKDERVLSELLKFIVLDINSFGEKYHLIVKDDKVAKKAIQDTLVNHKIAINRLEKITPCLEDVFVAIAHMGGEK